MFGKKKKETVEMMNEELIKEYIRQMQIYDPDSEEFAKMTENLERLLKGRSYVEGDKDRKADIRVRIAAIVATLAEVGAFIFAENIKDMILRGAAKGFIPKIKVF